MGFAKRLDLFRSINAEHKDSTILGSVLTFVCIFSTVVFFWRELKEYRSQKLSTRLFVQNLDKFFIVLNFDVELHEMTCEKIIVSMENVFSQINVDKHAVGEKGCRLVGNFFTKHMDNKLMIRPDLSSTLMDFMTGGGADGTAIDLSHTIHKMQFGRTVARLSALAEKYPTMIRPNPLDGVQFRATDGKSGHSMFWYEMNIVTAKIDGYYEMMYNYSKNTITSPQTQPFISFILDFSPIAVEYVDGKENFFEFLTYVLGIVGGILAIVKFLNNIILGLFIKRRSTEAEVMEMR